MNKIFSRSISINAFEHDETDNIITMQSHLVDIFHDIKVTLDISLPDYIVIDARVEMATVPKEGCFDMNEVIKRLIGIKIGSGFHKTVAERIGGSDGCLNIVQMISSAAPLSINSSWFMKHNVRKGEEEMTNIVESHLSGKCAGYK